MSQNKDIEHLLTLLDSHENYNVTTLPGGGGDRKYYRFTNEDGKTLIGVVADDLKEAEAFVKLSAIFDAHELPVPRVYRHTSDYRYYIEEDLGVYSLMDAIKKGDYDPEIIRRVMRELARLQTVPESEWRDAVVYPEFGERLIKWDLNYFKYEFVKPCGVIFNEAALENDFERLSDRLLSVPQDFWGFMMRDCQSRNVMLRPQPFFIDYQSGRKGPGLYDAVSFLWQAKAGFSDEFRTEMIDEYADAFSKTRDIQKTTILKFVDIYALFRTLQVLGAYGFRGLVQKRAHFIESIPGALRNLKTLIDRGVLDDFKELKRICEEICNDPRFIAKKTDRLEVKVFSFSYKKGYPEDLTGNGGGFMFDCRGMHNPGRYEEYKQLTGRDQPVIDFLEERGEVQRFVEHALALVSPSIERYLKRGFSSLQIGFGCTGGRHRSVYCAERTAYELARKFPEARIQLIHREQEIKEHLT